MSKIKDYHCKSCPLKIKDKHALAKHVEDHFTTKKEVLELEIHLQGVPFSMSRNKNYGKTPGFSSSMPWHKNNHR